MKHAVYGEVCEALSLIYGVYAALSMTPSSDFIKPMQITTFPRNIFPSKIKVPLTLNVTTRIFKI
jgi:hypothetical protein